MDTYDVAEKCGCNQVETAREEVKQVEPQRTYVPAVDVVDSVGETVLFADMPGVDESSIDIVLDKNVLTIKGTPEAFDCQGGDLVYREFGVGAFERSFTLGDSVDREGIVASIKDGVLKVTLPKIQRQARKIEVAGA